MSNVCISIWARLIPIMRCVAVCAHAYESPTAFDIRNSHSSIAILQYRCVCRESFAIIRIRWNDYRIVATADGPPDVVKIEETSNKCSERQCIWWRTAWRQKFFLWRQGKFRAEQLWCSHSFEPTMMTSKNIPKNEAIFIFIFFCFWLIAFVCQMEILCLHLCSRRTRVHLPNRTFMIYHFELANMNSCMSNLPQRGFTSLGVHTVSCNCITPNKDNNNNHCHVRLRSLSRVHRKGQQLFTSSAVRWLC